VDAADLEGYNKADKEALGFAPYWNPTEGAFWAGVVFSLDVRDPLFHRYQVRASIPLACQRGPADGAERVDITKGEVFSVSAYEQLTPFFNEYLSMPFEVPIKVTAIKKTDTANNREVWLWEVIPHNSVKAKIDTFRREHRAGLNAAERAAPPQQLRS
jgi:hypothetical protein